MANRELNITNRERHTVATLIAAGLTRSYIRTHHVLSEHHLRRIIGEPGWPELLQAKREALQALMGGAQ